MAYSFNGTNQSLTTTAPVTTGPVTMFSRWNRAAISNNSQVQLIISGGGSILIYYFNNTLDTGHYCASVGDSYQVAQVNVAFSINTWYTAVSTVVSRSSRTIWFNGSANTATGTVDCGPIATPTSFALPFEEWNGRLSDVAVWSVSLTTAEIDALNKGFKPTRIRPQSLVFYAPLIRNLQDLRGGLTITNNNSATVFDHPRVY